MRTSFLLLTIAVLFVFFAALTSFVWIENYQLKKDNVLISNNYFMRESYLISVCSIDANELALLERKAQIDEMKSVLSNPIYGDRSLRSWVVADEGALWKDFNLNGG
jgi:hypothetical protein